MNKVLINKLLTKLSLKDLYDEIDSNDHLVCVLGMILASKKPILFANLIRDFVKSVIINGPDKELENFLKIEIISMDGSEEIFINKTIKKAAVKKPPIDDDPCSRGFGSIRSC